MILTIVLAMIFPILIKASFIPQFEPVGGEGEIIDLSGGMSYADPTTGMEFMFVKGGCFPMGNTFGDGDSDEKPVHEVCLDDFYIGKYEVTQGEWAKGIKGIPLGLQKGQNFPITNISWQDAQEFINNLNRIGANNYRLPTEAEWEYACRSGGKREEYCGGGNPDAFGWHAANSNGSPQNVGKKQPNGLGLYDLSGNVSEWVQDFYGRGYYAMSARDNPMGPDSGYSKIGRGGSWRDAPRNLRAANRFNLSPAIRADNLGIRLVFTPH